MLAYLFRHCVPISIQNYVKNQRIIHDKPNGMLHEPTAIHIQ